MKKMIGNLEWVNCKSMVDKESVQKIELELGVQFPADYLEIASQCDGGRPAQNAFTVQDPELGPVGTSLEALLSLDLRSSSNLLTVYSWLKDQLPAYIIPFGEDGGSDYVCFDYRSKVYKKGITPKVVYWAHEIESQESIIPLSENFAQFLQMLQSPRKLPE